MNNPTLKGEVSKDKMARIQNKKQIRKTIQNYKLNLLEEGNSSLSLTSEIFYGFLTAFRNAVISDEAEVSLPLM